MSFSYRQSIVVFILLVLKHLSLGVLQNKLLLNIWIKINFMLCLNVLQGPAENECWELCTANTEPLVLQFTVSVFIVSMYGLCIFAN